ncbi:hypothetical protein ACQ4PT_033564 [Festuca glaucescens]
MAGGGRGAGRYGGGGGGRGGGGRGLPVVKSDAGASAGVLPLNPTQGTSTDQAAINAEFPQAMMQQMGAAAPGMFPMMQPNMWNVPMSQWSQFYGNQQIPPAAFNPMMMMPQGFTPNMPQSSNSQGSSVSLNNPSQQQQSSGGSKNKKKNQKSQISEGVKPSVDKGGNNAQLIVASGPGPILDLKFKNVICYNCGEPGHYVGLCTRVKRSFYKEVRVKVSVRDISKIPANKLFEMEQCFFLIDFSVETEGDAIDVDNDEDDPDQNNNEDKLEEEDELGDDFQALDKCKKYGGSNRMETDSANPDAIQGEKNMSMSVVPQYLETSVRSKVLGIEQVHIPAHAMVLRSAKDNIEKSILQRLKNFHCSNPDMFLPVDNSLTVDEMRKDVGDEVHGSGDQEDYSSDYPDEIEPWTLVSSRKKGRRKLIFKNGNRSNLEP